MKINLKLVLTFIVVVVLNTAMWGVQVASDTFSSNLGGYTGSGIGRTSSGWMYIPGNGNSASKTYALGASHINTTVQITYRLASSNSWESEDRFKVTANGVQVGDYQLAYGAYTTKTVTATTDAAGNLTMVFYTDTNNNNEYGYVDYVTINVPLPKEVCPGEVIPSLDGTSVTANDGFYGESISNYATYYYYFTPQAAGTLDVAISNSTKYGYDLYVYDGCGGSVLASQTNNVTNKSLSDIAVTANQTIVIAVKRNYSTTMSYDIEFTYTVPSANAVDDAFNTRPDVPVDNNVLGNDGPFGVVVTNWGTPSNGTLSGTTSSGDFIYTPNSGFLGTDTFTYAIEDPVTHTTDTATVTISINTNTDFQSGVQDFELINPSSTRNIIGNYVILGNTVECITDATTTYTGTCQNGNTYNDNAYMTKYIDIDGNSGIGAKTWNSSSSSFTLPAATYDQSRDILWAGLFWQGSINNLRSFSYNGYTYYNTQRRMYLNASGNVATKSITSNEVINLTSTDGNKVLFRLDTEAAYTPVQAYTFYYDTAHGNYGGYYAAYADVTNLLKGKNLAAGRHTVTIANITANEGRERGIGNIAGWSMVVIYKEQGTFAKARNISVYNGFTVVDSSTAPTVKIEGFKLPKYGDVSSKFSVFAGEGEYVYGDSANEYDRMVMKMNLTDAGDTMPGATDPDNIFDAIFANIDRNNGSNNAMSNNNGIDIDSYDVSTLMTSYRDVDVNVSRVYLALTSNLDYVTPSMMAFTTELYQPEVCYEERLYVVDEYGNETLLSGIGQEVDYNSTLRAKVYVHNNSNDIAENVSINRTPGQEDILPYQVGSTMYDNENPDFNIYPYPYAARSAYYVDPANDSLIDTDLFSFADGKFNLNIGKGASNVVGGNLDSNLSTEPNTAYFEYNTHVLNEDNASFSYVVSFRSTTLSITYDSAPLPKCTNFTNSFWGHKPPNPPSLSFGITDPWRTYVSTDSNSREIATKVSLKPFSLRGYSLDLTTGEPEVYDGHYNTNDTIPMIAFLSASDDTCTEEIADFAYVQIAHNSSTSLANDIDTGNTGLTLSDASKQRRIKANVLNWRDIIIADSSLNCTSTSLSSRLCGVPECLDTLTKITTAFAPKDVSTCFSGGATAKAPCDPDAYTGTCGGKVSDIILAKYNHDMGCAACLADFGGTEVCSADDFAIRPSDFAYDASANVIQKSDASIILSQAGTHPVSSANKLRSGEEYNMTIYARDYTLNATSEYNQSTGNLNPATKHYRYNGSLIPDDTATILSDVNITNLSASGQFYNGVTSQFVIRYDEVGVVDLDINDTDWASVDSDDTPVNDYTVVDALTGTSYTEPGYVIYSNSTTPLRLTVKPFAFNISAANLYDNDNGGGFTYLSNDMNMSARFPVTIRAENKSSGLTRNYSDSSTGLYEQLVTFALAVDSSSYPSSLTLVPFTPSNADLPFTGGVAVVSETDDNVTRFNFNRSTNTPVNPFRIDGSDTNLSVTDTDNVYGDANGSIIGDATFVYGRTHMARTRAMCGTGVTNAAPCLGNVTFYYEFYGNQGETDFNRTLVTNILGATPKRSIDSVNWYRNTVHNTGSDGNVSSTINSIPHGSVVAESYTQFTNNTSATIPYDGSQGFPYKATLELTSPTETQSWLIYDKYNTTNPRISGQLEYYGPGSWSSTTGSTATTVKDTGTTHRNKNTNRRIRW